MTEVEYWFKTRMYTMGILALVIAFIQVSIADSVLMEMCQKIVTI